MKLLPMKPHPPVTSGQGISFLSSGTTFYPDFLFRYER